MSASRPEWQLLDRNRLVVLGNIHHVLGCLQNERVQLAFRTGIRGDVSAINSDGNDEPGSFLRNCAAYVAFVTQPGTQEVINLAPMIPYG